MLWVLAVPRGMTDQLLNTVNTSSNDKIYVKYSQCFKTYGNATNATDTTNYALNNASWPNATTITACADNYNSTANIRNNYTDLILIEIEGPTLTAASNTLTISSTIESIYGDRLGNSGLKMLEKRTTATDDYYFAYNFKTAAASEATSVRKLIQYINDKEYVAVNYNRTVDSEQTQIALNTTLSISKSGTFNLTADYGTSSVDSCNTFKELDISSTESGTILIKNAHFQTVTVNAPNAEVKFENVEIDKMNVVDVLDGSLLLKNGTNCAQMEITDYRNGCKINVDDSSGVNSVTVNTIGSVTLALNSAASVTIAKPAKVTFTSPIENLTLAPTAQGSQFLYTGTGDSFYHTITDQTVANKLDTAISYVNDSLEQFEQGLNSANTSEFTVTMQPYVRMTISSSKEVEGLNFKGNKLTYTGGNQQFDITVTATCTLDHITYTASKTYRIVGSATDIEIAS